MLSNTSGHKRSKDVTFAFAVYVKPWRRVFQVYHDFNSFCLSVRILLRMFKKYKILGILILVFGIVENRSFSHILSLKSRTFCLKFKKAATSRSKTLKNLKLLTSNGVKSAFYISNVVQKF